MYIFKIYNMQDPKSWGRVYGETNNLLKPFRNKIKGLFKIAHRLSNVIFDNLDAMDLLKHDTPKTFFYLDPPYVPDTRKINKRYINEPDEKYHIDLCKKIITLKGKVLISGYDNEIYNDILKGWNKIYNKKKKAATTGGLNGEGDYRQEIVWRNYKVSAIDDNLFSE